MNRPVPSSSREPISGGGELPSVSGWRLAWFVRYSRWYLGRHFHALRVDVGGSRPDSSPGTPTVVFLNHASWWDPLVCLAVAQRFFPGHVGYAPIDSAALQKYAFFRHLGFFGVEPNTSRGARTFLRQAEAIVRRPGAALWVTPQGEFGDARQRPIRFKPGLAHLAARIERAPAASPRGPASGGAPANPPSRVCFLPLALEYTYWEERLPEVLIRFGTPLEARFATSEPESTEHWRERLEQALEGAMDGLAAEARRRDPQRFVPLLAGATGTGGVYDTWRRWKALLQGRRFDSRHGRLG